MTFRVGQLVFCVDASGWETWGTIKEGGIYTVAGLEQNQGQPGLHLEEVVSVCGTPYFARRFRPLIENITEIAFTHGAPADSERFDNRRKIGVPV